MTKRASIIKQASDRLTSLCAYGESRHDLKRALRDTAEAKTGRRPWTQSTSRIHSLNTQGAYWRVVRAYVDWARSTYDIRDLDDLDVHADELVHAYLEHKQRNGKGDGSSYSPYSLQQTRAALRLFHTSLAVLVDGREGKERVFARIPAALRIQALRD